MSLPPAGGPTTGTINDGSQPPVRIAVVGESTAAGCGVDTHDEGFTGSLARELAVRTGRPVAWEVIGENSVTATQIREQLVPRVSTGLDLAVVLAGVNDLLQQRSPEEWGEDLTAIVDGLGGRARQVAVAGLPSFEIFTQLPAGVRLDLTQRAAALDEASRKVCAQRSGATWVDSADGLAVGPDFFAGDGFHPSAVGYRRWALVVADRVTSPGP